MCAGDLRVAGAYFLVISISQPGKGKGLDMLWINAQFSAAAYRALQQLAEALVQLAVIGAATTKDEIMNIRGPAFDGLANCLRRQFQQGGLDILGQLWRAMVG